MAPTASTSYDPDGLLADLSAAHEQLTFEMDPRADDVEPLVASTPVSSTPIMSNGLAGGSSFPAAPARHRPATTNASAAVLFHMASSQGNSGLLSVSPRAVGPHQPLRGVKRQRSSLSGRRDRRDLWLVANDESVIGAGGLEPDLTGANASDSMIMLGPRAAMRAARTAAQRTAAQPAANLRKMTQTRNLRAGRDATDGPVTPASRPTASIAPTARSRRDHAVAADDGVDDVSDEEQEVEATWSMIARMRTWRQDAILQHLYETAAFWGDKILSWTGEPNDAFWLAQTYFLTGAYVRAERILMAPLPPPRMPASSPGDGPLTNGKGKAPARSKSDELPLVASNADAADGSWMSEMIRQNEGGLWSALGETVGGDAAEGVALKKGGAKMVDWSMPCRYLAALSMVSPRRSQPVVRLNAGLPRFTKRNSPRRSSFWANPTRSNPLAKMVPMCRATMAI